MLLNHQRNKLIMKVSDGQHPDSNHNPDFPEHGNMAEGEARWSLASKGLITARQTSEAHTTAFQPKQSPVTHTAGSACLPHLLQSHSTTCSARKKSQLSHSATQNSWYVRVCELRNMSSLQSLCSTLYINHSSLSSQKRNRGMAR